MLKFRINSNETTKKRKPLWILSQIRILFPHLNYVQLFILLFLIILTVAAYWDVRNNDFINLDDNLYVTENSPVQKGITSGNILWAFNSTENGQWHPITWLSHMLDYQFYGLNAGGHHLTNLFFHVMNTLLLFILFYRITAAPWQSGFVAALFAIHPLHVESVAWVAERRDVLYAFFWILTLLTYLHYVKKQNNRWRILLLLCFFFAVMSKSMAVTLPFILLLLDYWPLGWIRLKNMDHAPLPLTSPSLNVIQQKVSIWNLISEKLPLFSVAGVISLFTIFTNLGVSSLTSLDKLSLTVRFQNAVVSYMEYISKMFWPNPLAVLYPHQINFPFLKVAWATSLLLIITVLVFLAKRKCPYLFFGWMWYLVTLLPVIGLVQAGIQGMADRFTYIPMIGLFIIIVYGYSDILRRWPHSKVVLATVGGLLLLILTFFTRSQVLLWRNSITLFEHTLSVTTNNYLIHNNLGVTLFRKGNAQDAMSHFIKALEINPLYADPHYNLGILFARQGKDKEAMVQFIEALRIKPDKKEAHNDLGVILNKHGRIHEAIFHFAEAARINPNYAEAYLNLGIAMVRQQRNKEAIHYFGEALRINPSDAKIHNNLAVSLANTGKIEEAIGHYNQALQIDPNSTDAHYNLGSLLTLQEKDQEAIPHYYEVLRINPSDAQAHYELAKILVRQTKNQEAAAHLAEAVRITPNYGDAHLTLGMLYLVMGKKDLALAQYKILKTINNNLAKTLYKEILTRAQFPHEKGP